MRVKTVERSVDFSPLIVPLEYCLAAWAPAGNGTALMNEGDALQGTSQLGLIRLGLAALLATGTAGAAKADLKLCNATPSRIGVALGYQDRKGWATEGWWNVPAETCENLLKGTLPSRYIYVYAIDYERGGEWFGEHRMCINEKSFTIRNTQNCEDRGYRSRGFYEIDTGTSQSWTIRLSDPKEAKADE
jgi:uncharacterized membrane protein